MCYSGSTLTQHTPSLGSPLRLRGTHSLLLHGPVFHDPICLVPTLNCHVLVNSLLLPPKVKDTTRLYLSHQLEVPLQVVCCVGPSALVVFRCCSPTEANDMAANHKLRNWRPPSYHHPREEGDHRAVCVCLG